MSVIVGRSIGRHCCRIDVGIGSRSQKVLDDWDMSLESSSLENRLEDHKIRRNVTWFKMRWSFGRIRLDIAEWSLSTLLGKKLANMEGRDLKSVLDDSWEIGLRCRSLLMVCQSLQGFEEEEEISDELKSLMAWIMDEWYALVAIQDQSVPWLHTSTLAHPWARQTRSFRVWWVDVLPALRLQARPWVPSGPTLAPNERWWGSQSLAPRRVNPIVALWSRH